MTEQASPDAAAALPKTIGTHEVLSRLATGPMGDLLMAKAGDESRHVIKKPTSPYVKVSKDAIKMLNASFDLRLRPYLEIDHDAKRDRYLVMDYFEVRSASLSALDGLTKGEAVEWLISSCSALAALHKNKVVHGNLKSSNILVRRSKDRSIPGTVAGALPIISDIGLRYAYDKEYFVGATAAAIYPYMAPEVIEMFLDAGLEDDWRPEPSADVYSFAVSFIEIYSGFQLFEMPGEDPSPQRYLEEKRRRRYVLAERNDLKSEVDIKTLNEVLASCLDPEPKNRFANAQQLEKALQGTLVKNGKA
ncbi:MAG: serine/threonine protein kinase [Pseudohongiellaceae bacterium]|jgi:serine/threonine protein kinase